MDGQCDVIADCINCLGHSLFLVFSFTILCEIHCFITDYLNTAKFMASSEIYQHVANTAAPPDFLEMKAGAQSKSKANISIETLKSNKTICRKLSNNSNKLFTYSQQNKTDTNF